MTSPKTTSIPVDQPFLPHETLGYALKRAQQAMRLHMDRQLKEIGLNAPQYNVLVSLEAEPGASNARLARRAFVTPQTMQAMLVKLEQSGLIERSPDAEHGRIQRTELTEEGRASLAQAHLAAQKSERLAREASTPDAIEMLTRVAEALA
ncbi:MarR family winged helix-turn-helix transcriptional regulator [Methylocapsa acidiphila]|uniref:MarR family winged helix-turn-helix transcriptional regulator n=1 Tax=Methylocapsa acidiphila TaxID=133552 RepID=UPI00040B063A|nr:MarR family transcriptional regulator [Methylocapsa acidiphila]